VQEYTLCFLYFDKQYDQWTTACGEVDQVLAGEVQMRIPGKTLLGIYFLETDHLSLVRIPGLDFAAVVDINRG